MTREARQKLGEVIRWHVEQRGKSDRMIADFCGAPISQVVAWKEGRLVPDGPQWHALKRGIHRALNEHNQLYQRAKAEQDAERETIKRGITSMRINANGPTNGAAKNGANTPINTALGDKLRAVVEQLPPVSEPKEETVKTKNSSRANKPPGAYTLEAQKERLDFARGLLLQRPHMRVGGPDGLVAAIRTRFGISVAPNTLVKLKAQVQQEIDASRAPKPAVSAPVTPPLANVAPTPSTTVPTSDLEAAVQLILGAIPNLRTFTISVADDGEASVDYKVREVKVVETGGSLKVRR